MNKKLMLVVIIIVVAIGGGLAFLLMRDKPSSAPETGQSKTTPTDSATDMADAQTTTGGVYTDYSAEKLAQADGTKLLFFHAAWCPQCRQLEMDIKDSAIPSGITIFKVDYDTNQALRQKYGVRLQTTLVKVDDQGNEIEKFVAYDDPTLEAVIQNLL